MESASLLLHSSPIEALLMAVDALLQREYSRPNMRSRYTGGTVPENTEARMHVLDLETELIEVHELTLPPETYPWDGFDRRQQLRLRDLHMENARENRIRALLRRWLRRILTIGLWQN